MLKKIALSGFLIIISGLLPVFSQNTPDASNTKTFGYVIDDKNNNGITDIFETDSLPKADSSANTVNPGPVDEIRQRWGHRNLHGQHGKEFDRGESPHAH
ncbi:MAG: hypothetical protein A2268_08115 [Candidatus Raymondbacteria bacterium RifOxyA12_full_50_37]|uniref:EF-hand domain-containing protein n=1 Tax=Candidatus Raymondbacteria bacterium RIFOXYD12_FULL_49_13 TaxID=1817890 RepID=A0A1F7F110_UNCRA|nr:MAG: hypothetical protein A2268_08115 [Candidatus Raymondbacteria bacterium RifOxyA12_full_50_37]OGJ93314.1 MAG: hypothetical protein A2487_06820 [Candidatus Raymondbacteria bacterium RifOxyC12_full_50_8]OGJ93532.1 MAG: hypothetical protein A2248_09160 [Candidatus Raymondbacteria bacterium RIFOXYA2_FULL_49_16]OGJ98802.1 MAG: hypothetical protein A2453_09970 [Candidatus Raymondbacteria bacterium RIFOXYC2_FULL_50_21]OGK00335.1 MAG: hypothetical protein A2519_01070 [Candidatus Raymondbacteria b